METRNGLIEFRTVTVEYVIQKEHKSVTKTKQQLQYRQCFKGMWDHWKPVQED